MKSINFSPVVLAFIIVGAPSLAHACSVCYGAQGDPQTTGMTGAILTLLGITGLVVSGIIVLFLRIMLRARQYGPTSLKPLPLPVDTITGPVET